MDKKYQDVHIGVVDFKRDASNRLILRQVCLISMAPLGDGFMGINYKDKDGTLRTLLVPQVTGLKILID